MESIQDNLNKLKHYSEYSKQYQKILQEKVFTDPDVIEFLQSHPVNDEVISRGASKLFEFVTEKEKFIQNRTSLVEGHYPRLVFFNNRISVEYVPTDEEITRRKRLQAKNRIKLYHIGSEVSDISLRDFDIDPSRETAFEKVLDFIEDYDPKSKQMFKGLYLYGAFGIGKTFLLGGMANLIAQRGSEVAMIYFPSFCEDLKDAMKDNTVSEMLNEIKNVEILIIDDIGSERLSEWIRDSVLAIIVQHRMQRNLSTFFTSNKSMDELENEHLRRATGDEPVKAGRIMERIRYLAQEVEMNGPNRRNP